MADYTVKDIAKMAGISTGTVSRVLNGAGNVDPEIVERAMKVLRDTGYLENKRYRNRERKTARTNRICVIAPGMSPAWSNNSLWTNYFSGIEQACRSRNYKCEIHFAEPGVSPLDIAKSLQSCDGVLMKTPTVLPDFLPFLKKEIPLVCFGGFNPLLECPQFVLDNHACGMLVTETLLQLGHRDIVFVNHESGHRMFVGRCIGYMETMRCAGQRCWRTSTAHAFISCMCSRPRAASRCATGSRRPWISISRQPRRATRCGASPSRSWAPTT